MRHVVGIVASLSLVLLSACGPGELQAGAGERVIDLPVGIGLSGYAASDMFIQPPADDPGGPVKMMSASRGIYAAPTVKVVLFERGWDRLAIAKIDAVLMSAALLTRTVDLAKAEGLDLTGGKLLISATHTHAAGHRFSQPKFWADMAAGRDPDEQDALAHATDSFSQEMTDRVAKSLVNALLDAKKSMRPAVIGHGFGENKTAAHDRRCADDAAYGADNVDNRVTVIRVDEKDGGKPIAVMFHYAMHGVFFDFENRNMSGDGPAHVEFAVERGFETPVVAMYLQGNAGDKNPSGNGFNNSQGMQWAGQDLAKTVLQVRDGIAPAGGEVALKASERWFPVSHAILGYTDEDNFPEEGAVLCQQFYQHCNVGPITPSLVGPACLSQALPDGGKHYGLVGAAQLGGLHIVAVPGEPVAEFGRQLLAGTKEVVDADTIVLGYAQDHDGYLLTSEDWLRGGYEPTISFWGWKWGPYLIEQTVDTFREMLGQEPQHVRPEKVPMPDLRPRQYEPTPVSPSTQAPAAVGQPPQSARRLTELRFSWTGGDPLLGHPEVTLEKRSDSGSFEPVKVNGWIPVTSLHGGEMVTFYSPAPNYRQSTFGEPRAHQWEVLFEPTRDMAEGAYRFVARGQALVGGTTAPYEITSEPFVVEPAALVVDAVTSVADGKLVVEATLRYPAEKPRMSPVEGNKSWQIGNFRMVDPRFPPPFVPVVEGDATADATVETGGSASPASIEFVARTLAEGQRTFEPGQGPGFHLEAPYAGGAWKVTIPAGALRDHWGNVNNVAVVLESNDG